MTIGAGRHAPRTCKGGTRPPPAGVPTLGVTPRFPHPGAPQWRSTAGTVEQVPASAQTGRGHGAGKSMVFRAGRQRAVSEAEFGGAVRYWAHLYAFRNRVDRQST